MAIKMVPHRFDKIIEWNLERFEYYRSRIHGINEMRGSNLSEADCLEIEQCQKRRDRIGSFITLLDYRRSVDNGLFDEDDD